MDEWTTPAPLIDLAVEFPELAPYARTTTRLHPRRGEPGVFDSSIGGRPLWPADEPWPIRPGSYFGPYDEERVPAVLLLQLYRRDVAQLPFPEGTDLLQVLWYPIPHETFGEWDPEAMLFWRDSASVTEMLAEVPLINPDYPEYAPFPEYVPIPCLLHPEPGVVEYPSSSSDLPQGWDWSRLADFEATSGQDASSTLFIAPGIKVGGWPNFFQEPVWPDCPSCQAQMEHLLTLHTAEWGSEGWERWIPRADDRFRAECRNGERSEELRAAQSPSGIDLGGGCINLFFCPTCPGMPHAQWHDR